MNLWNRLKDERGNVFILVIGLVWAAIFLSFLFFDLFTVYAAKRIGQTAADAAALAAAKEMKRIYEAEVDLEIGEQMNLLRTQIELEALALAASSESLSLDEAREIVMDRYDMVGPYQPVRAKIKNPDHKIDASIALRYLYRKNTSGITGLICGKLEEHRDEIEDAAKEYASKNGADDSIKLLFPYEGEIPQVYVSVKRTTPFVTVDEEKTVSTAAAAKVKWLQGIPYDYEACQAEW